MNKNTSITTGHQTGPIKKLPTGKKNAKNL